MKKARWPIIFTLVIGLALIPLAYSPSNASELSTPVYLDGAEMPHIDAVQKEHVIYVPLRSFGLLFGMGVEWNATGGTTIIAKGTFRAVIAPGQSIAQVNGVQEPMSGTAFLSEGKLMVPLKWLAEHVEVEWTWDPVQKSVYIETNTDPLPTIQSYAQLKELLKASQESQYGQLKRIALTDTAEVAMESAAADTGSSEGSPGYSETNVQVQGVDEADIVKTDGKYIYQINENRLLIYEAYPADQMKLAGEYSFEPAASDDAEQTFHAVEMYLDKENNQAIVIGTSYRLLAQPMSGKTDAAQSKSMIYPPFQDTSTVQAIVLDIENIAKPNPIRTVELEGHYIDSRKIGSSLYLVSNKYLDTYHILQDDYVWDGPLYRDSLIETDVKPLPIQDIQYFPGPDLESKVLMLGALDLARTNQEMQVEAFIGAGQNVYASSEHLYVAVQQWKSSGQGMEKKIASDQMVPSAASAVTKLYKFKLDSGHIEYTTQGEVPGTILNQFSMDEHEGFFRIATTTGEAWRSGEQTSQNHVYVLGPSLEITGKLEGLAPGERIYSVRFMGDRGYVVTFKQVDPLFVLDLANPAAPQVLGQLKIPGYSDYLHPYDENHIIGFGKDTVVVEQKDENGNPVGSAQAFYTGMKMALFDVSDVSHPKELHKVMIGDRGTESELLHDHKSLLFDREQNLLAFPVTLMEVKGDKIDPYGYPAYGEFAFQGAYVYHLSPEEGFKLRGTISHLDESDMSKAGYYGFDYRKHVNRILYIGDTLYTLSSAMLKANDLNSLTELGQVSVPALSHKTKDSDHIVIPLK
ncbi:beta-propeller domain-containing protein [Marinicrinis lubricantis]|uniref:Beta-propeller domain-containing protein n=1 Tax=Marinicrinis lubricantis TaxID=2086470 RepID=A0ABW1IJI0_9BACL